VADLPAGEMVDHQLLADAVAASVEETLGVAGAWIEASLGEITGSDGQLWTGLVVRVEGTPPDEGKHLVVRDNFRLPVFVRWHDLREPLGLWAPKSRLLDSLRSHLGVAGPKPRSLLIFPPEPRLGRESLQGGAMPAGAGFDPKPFLNSYTPSGWLNRDFPALERLGDPEKPTALRIPISQDVPQFEVTRAAVIHAAGNHGLAVFDGFIAAYYPPGEAPEVQPYITKDGSVIDEISYDAEWMRFLSDRFGPLAVSPLSPAIDAQGVREDFRDKTDELPLSLWALPANQALITGDDPYVSGYLFNNDALVIPASAPTAALERLEKSRVERRPGGGTAINPHAWCPEWPAVLEELGWAYMVTGPDALWGELHISRGRQAMHDDIRRWLRGASRRWVEFVTIDGELRRRRMP